MVDFRYIDGAKVLPSADVVKTLRPAEAPPPGRPLRWSPGELHRPALRLGRLFVPLAAGLSLIFGVTRIVNFAHGSFYMVGIYVAYSAVAWIGEGPGYWPALLVAAVAVGVVGALVEILLLRRIYHAPELFQLLATFALVLVIKDAALWLWGPETPGAFELRIGEILGLSPRAGLFLIVMGARAAAIRIVRAPDREMVGALGVARRGCSAVFALGACSRAWAALPSRANRRISSSTSTRSARRSSSSSSAAWDRSWARTWRRC
jgi:hypothetical protein